MALQLNSLHLEFSNFTLRAFSDVEKNKFLGLAKCSELIFVYFIVPQLYEK